ncbi:MAG: hypothetical protein NT069_03325 [Planctomycetota bacterium]|nr:hypothetical protein [Planctomycetota bacterium]
MPRRKSAAASKPLYTPTSAAEALAADGKPISPRRVRELANAAGVAGCSIADLALLAGLYLVGEASSDRFYTQADVERIRDARGPGRDRQGTSEG